VNAAGPARRRLGGRGLALGLALISLLVLGVGNAVVWGPLWWHFRVDVAAVPAAVMQRHRQLPSDAVLATVAEASMITDHPLRGDTAVRAARRILAGELALPALPVLPIENGFVPSQLERGVPVQQVFIASLIVPELLLRANEHEPDPAFVQAASRYVQGFAAHEAQVAFPTGLLFNEHPVANRAAVLARLWRQVRATADEALARDVHTMAVRAGEMLARPAHFVAATNHGVMQNVGLLQLAAAFPTLPQAERWREVALHRLAGQMPAYIGSDGGVLEHSAGYHFHGVVLSGYIVRLLDAMGQPVPPAWRQAHQASRDYLATLQRPDGSLPAIGNTYRYQWRLPPLVDPDATAWARSLQNRPGFTRSFPVTGTAVWWDAGTDGSGVQTVIPWGWFPSHGHLRAQEMSLLIWSAGTDWSTNTGYWPNSDAVGFDIANGWGGGNGPHVIGEPWQSQRRTVVRGQLQQDGLRLLDLERVVDNGPLVRRQVLHWKTNRWLVLDSYQDAQNRPLRVVWTAAPETVQAPAGERAFAWQRPDTGLRFTLAVDGSDGVAAAPLSGSREPFGGWVAFDRKAVPAPAVDTRLPSPQGWMLATLDLSGAADGAAQRARMLRYAGPERWSLQWPAPAGTVTVTRHDDKLTIDDAGAASQSLRLNAGPVVDSERAAIQAAGDALRTEYPRFRTGEDVRRERSLLLGVLWLMACGAWWFWARRPRA